MCIHPVCICTLHSVEMRKPSVTLMHVCIGNLMLCREEGGFDEGVDGRDGVDIDKRESNDCDDEDKTGDGGDEDTDDGTNHVLRLCVNMYVWNIFNLPQILCLVLHCLPKGRHTDTLALSLISTISLLPFPVVSVTAGVFLVPWPCLQTLSVWITP